MVRSSITHESITIMNTVETINLLHLKVAMKTALLLIDNAGEKGINCDTLYNEFKKYLSIPTCEEMLEWMQKKGLVEKKGNLLFIKE